MTKSIGMAPLHTGSNRFVGRFAECFTEGGITPREFSWQALPLGRFDLVLFHWPNEFFAARDLAQRFSAALKLALMAEARLLYGTRFVWVVHNVAPHDEGVRSPAVLAVFLRLLGGIVHLSEHSRLVISAAYPLTTTLPFVITRHGHYRELMTLPATPRPAARAGRTRLVCCGQIRPYKRIDVLIDCVKRRPDVALLIVGGGRDGGLRQRLADMAGGCDNVTLDLRAGPLPEVELEQAIDGGDAVVLSYRDVLNSGATLLALSRNRPVLAPRRGSLPEVQERVGSDWLSLYEGPLTPAIIGDFVAHVRRRQGNGQPDLAAYDWREISADLRAFADSLP